MSVRNYPGNPSNGANTSSAGLSGATTGTKLTYTCPAGAQAVCRFVSVMPTAGAATIQIIAGTTTRLVQQGTTQMQLACYIPLSPGDTVKIFVSVLDAASVFDAIIGVEEFPAT